MERRAYHFHLLPEEKQVITIILTNSGFSSRTENDMTEEVQNKKRNKTQ